ncbi:MAG: C25 family cysteine peptidase [Saprospiraceae bacterium]
MLKLSKSIPIKILLCAKKKLIEKYGDKFNDINNALVKLKEADLKRNILTHIVYMDDDNSQKITKLPASKKTDAKSCKIYIDKIYKSMNPAYLCLIGAQDIIPFFEFTNPLFSPTGDSDELIYSDLPYACENASSTEISDFIGPSRVIGRLPDIPDINDYKYFIKIIKFAAQHKSSDLKSFNNYFALSVKLWKGSSMTSTKNIFGNNDKLLLSPPTTEKHSKTVLKPLLHFYNNHGALFAPEYYGQTGNNYPIAQHSSSIIGKVSVGTIVSAECCFGAQLYNNKNLGQPDKSLANTYLGEGAAAFVGSTTIAYGPADGQGLADLLCQYFLIKIKEGASVGRAFLEARQRFIKDSAEFDPYELKTLHQFILLGDPSLVPFEIPKNKLSQESIEARRDKMSFLGKALQNSTQVYKSIIGKALTYNKKTIQDILKEVNFTNVKTKKSFQLSKNKNHPKNSKSIMGSESVFRVFVKSEKKLNINKISALVVRENKERVLSYKVYVSK